MPERLRTFGLPRVLSGTNQKRSSLRDLCAFAVKVNNMMLPLINRIIMARNTPKEE
jgi:hypothetical protein